MSMKKILCLVLVCILCGSFIMAAYADENKEKSGEAKEAALAGSEKDKEEKADDPGDTASDKSKTVDAGVFNYTGFGDKDAVEAMKKELRAQYGENKQITDDNYDKSLNVINLAAAATCH